MGYLKCNKCGGYYELQEGESHEDFSDKCECGGSLNYVQNLDEHVIDELDPMGGINFCPNCESEIVKNEKFCTKCGNEIGDKTSKEDKSTSRFNDLIKTDFRAILLGLIIVFISFIVGYIWNLTHLTSFGILIGGLITGYFSKKGFKKGIINGASVGVIFMVALCFFIFPFYYFTNPNYLDTQITHHLIGNHITLTEVLSASIVSSIIFGIYGGVIGAIGGIVGNRFSKNK
ncbi:MAG TPA: DUF5518 domain-containing protein [Methanobacterium sp.]|nr:DUF5518 domain-containing protein [Methanobacterium sp.]